MLEYIVRYDGRRINLGGNWTLQDDLLEEEAGTFGTYSFTLAPTHPMAEPGAFVTEDPSKEVTFSERYADGREAELFRGWVKKTSLDTDLLLTVECEGMLSYLQSTVVRPYACRPMADLPDGTELITTDPFEWLVYQHNEHCVGEMQFDVGYNPRVGEVAAGTSWNSTWDEINDKFCSGLDRYLHARTDGMGRRVVDLLDGGAGEGTQVIVLGENVVSMDISGESSEIVTAIVPRATLDDTYNQERGERIDRREFGIRDADISEIVGNASTIVRDGDRMVNWRMVEAYGFREEKREYEADSPETLAQLAAADLDPTSIGERTANAIEVSAVDLHAANPSIQPIRILDWNRVFVRAYGLEDDQAELGVHSGGRLILDQWLPCSKLHISSVHPEDSWYRFGDLPQTLTRMSALRMGMLRRGNGTLVRRTDGTEWNNDRTWDRAQEVEDGYKDADDQLRDEFNGSLDTWGQHLTDQFGEETSKWYQSLDDAQKENAQGREELLKHLDEVEGKWSDEFGRLDGELGDLSDTVDSHHRELLDGIRETAENAQRTFFAYCATPGSTRAKAVSDGNLTKPGGEAFQLAKGVVVDVQFEYANTASSPTLNIANTGAHAIYTNGEQHGVWQDGQVVRMLYDGSYWQACSTDIYGKSVTVGNPAQANFYTNGQVAEMRIGSTYYWHVGVDGQTVGLQSRAHIDIGSDSSGNGHVDVIASSGHYARFGYGSKSGTGSAPILVGDTSLIVGTESSTDGYLMLNNGDATFNAQIMRLYANQLYLLDGLHVVAQRSIVVDPGGHSYVDVPASDVGLRDCSGYAWAFSNGDLGAANVAVTGVSYNPRTRGLTIHFASSRSGQTRVNLWGFYCPTQVMDPGVEGPEIFDDPASTVPAPQLAEPSTGEAI